VGVQQLSRGLDRPEVIMKDTPSDEGALVLPYQLVHARSQSKGEHLGNQLANTMNQARASSFLRSNTT
jgi:hypothetical protein